MSVDIPEVKKGAGCWKIGLISCAVISVIVLVSMFGVGYFLYRHFGKNQNFKDMVQCTKNMIEVHGALDRYEVRYGSYPSDLEKLKPDFLKDVRCLHCPADKSGNVDINYTYHKPPSNASGETVVLTCSRHHILKKPMVLRMQKNGQYSQMNINDVGENQKRKPLR